jgi:hypothetical protein
MDLTLTYHLARAHIGSLALEPEAGMHPAAAAAAASDGHFALSQIAAVGAAKASALWALELASSRAAFGDRLAYLPTFYHFVRANTLPVTRHLRRLIPLCCQQLLSHCAGFLLLLVQRKGRFMLANEGRCEFVVVQAAQTLLLGWQAGPLKPWLFLFFAPRSPRESRGLRARLRL